MFKIEYSVRSLHLTAFEALTEVYPMLLYSTFECFTYAL